MRRCIASGSRSRRDRQATPLDVEVMGPNQETRSDVRLAYPSLVVPSVRDWRTHEASYPALPVAPSIRWATA
jgi:hypothetical protein